MSHVGKIVIGTAQFGMDYGVNNPDGQPRLTEVSSLLGEAYGHGIRMLDTAVAYGDCEQRLGEIGIGSWQVVTKLPVVPHDCKDIPRWVRLVVKASLGRLGVESVHGLLLHRPLQLLEEHGSQLYQALQQIKSDGLVRKIGISIYDPSELDVLLHDYRLDIVQSPLNVFDRRLVDTGWLARLSHQGIEVQVRSVFLQGLLLMARDDRPQKFRRFASLWNAWDGWLNDTGATSLQASLGFVFSHTDVERVIIGVDNRRQLREIVSSVGHPVQQCPSDLSSLDVDLINPSRWGRL